jgi:hypothetical protein
MLLGFYWIEHGQIMAPLQTQYENFKSQVHNTAMHATDKSTYDPLVKGLSDVCSNIH